MQALHQGRVGLQMLHQLSSLMDRLADQALADAGISYSQLLVLMGIGHQKNSSQADVAEQLSLTPAAVSRMVDHLIGKGWVTRTENAKNRRQHILGLTKSGQEVAKRSQGLLEAAFSNLYQSLDGTELKILEGSLQKLSLQAVKVASK